MNHPKPKYRIGQRVVGRTYHLAKIMPSEIVMIEIDSARYDTKYGHWIYCGTVWHKQLDGTNVEIYQQDIEYKFKEK